MPTLTDMTFFPYKFAVISLEDNFISTTDKQAQLY